MAVPGARRIAAALVLAIGLVHLALVAGNAAEAAYLGALFLIAGITSLVVAVQLWRFDDRTLWLAGSLLCVGMMVGFLLSRTVGLPAYKAAGIDPAALLSLAAEIGYLLLALVSLRASSSTAAAAGRSSGPGLARMGARPSAAITHGSQPHTLPPASPRCSPRQRDSVAGHEPYLPQ
jgi:hypothetical protein